MANSQNAQDRKDSIDDIMQSALGHIRAAMKCLDETQYNIADREHASYIQSLMENISNSVNESLDDLIHAGYDFTDHRQAPKI